MKHTWIGDSGALCNITIDDADLYDVTNINKLLQGSLGNIITTKNGKLGMKVYQVDGSKKLHLL